jgi:hypothetical protein
MSLEDEYNRLKQENDILRKLIKDKLISYTESPRTQQLIEDVSNLSIIPPLLSSSEKERIIDTLNETDDSKKKDYEELDEKYKPFGGVSQVFKFIASSNDNSSSNSSSSSSSDIPSPLDSFIPTSIEETEGLNKNQLKYLNKEEIRQIFGK